MSIFNFNKIMTYENTPYNVCACIVYHVGNVLITSSTGKVGLGLDTPQEKLHIAGAVRGNGPGGALDIRTEYGTLTLGAQD